MDSISVRKIEIIVKDLLSEFEKESGKLQVEYDDNASRILEIEENIHNYRENEDTDFQVFSPRKIDNQNEKKIEVLNAEKENIEFANKSLYRQIKYYSDKKEKLNDILAIIEEDREMKIDEQPKPELEDISQVDEKILEYYDSIVEKDDDDRFPEEPENIGTEIKSGWRLIKDEIDTPIVPIDIESDITENKDSETELLIKNLQIMTEKLETETRRLEEDYNKTKDEIHSVIGSINMALEKIKK